MKLAGKHVVVTGAASGIGRAAGVRFAAEGAAQVVVADLDYEGAVSVAQEIGGLAVGVDVSRQSEVTALVAQAREAGGPIALVFSNAGVPGPPGGPEASDSEFQRTWEVNVMAQVWAARACCPK